MTNETKALAFCHWLQGYFELNDVVDGSTHISPEQAELIRKKLDGVVPSERNPPLPLGRIDLTELPPSHLTSRLSTFRLKDNEN